MKFNKLLVLSLAIIIAVSFVGCSKDKDTNTEKTKNTQVSSQQSEKNLVAQIDKITDKALKKNVEALSSLQKKPKTTDENTLWVFNNIIVLSEQRVLAQKSVEDLNNLNTTNDAEKQILDSAKNMQQAMFDYCDYYLTIFNPQNHGKLDDTQKNAVTTKYKDMCTKQQKYASLTKTYHK